MEPFRRNCIILMVVFFLLGTFPPLMGWYNRRAMWFGIPSFIVGFLLVILGMLFTLLALYRHDAAKGHDSGTESSSSEERGDQ